jgi:hypothetical protein
MRMNSSTPRWAGFLAPSVTWAVFVCVLLSCLIFVWRGRESIAAVTMPPGVAVTSGFEGESFFALWRAVHHQPIYGDATRLPYASAYFNWLFYWSYAGPVAAAVGWSGDASIPLAGRLITACAALLGTVIFCGLLRRVLGGHALVAAGLATFVFFGPLVGWWAHTLRPDVGALALETAALAAMVMHHRGHPLAATLGACLLFYGAWALKQTYVCGLGATVLFLLMRRQWRTAGWLVLGTVILWTATFLVLGPSYRSAFRSMAVSSVFYPMLGLGNLQDLLVKAAPLWLLAAVCLMGGHETGANRPTILAADARLLSLIGLIIGVPLAFAASCKSGAASNYYFTVLVMLALFVASSLATHASHRLLLAAFVLAGCMQLLVLLGKAGKISLADQTQELATTWTAWQKADEPRFAHVTTFNLPWLSPNSPPIVTAFNYGPDRARGLAFESDGIGGLIATGHFRTLLLPADTREAYDAGSLRRYSRGETINRLTIFRRHPPVLDK